VSNVKVPLQWVRLPNDIGQISVHEAAQTALLHHVRSIISRHFAERVAAINDGRFEDLRIGQNETGICKKMMSHSICKKNKKKGFFENLNCSF
jgi:hypothetical protein